MKLIINDKYYCEAEILTGEKRVYCEFGQLKAIGEDTKLWLKLNQPLVVRGRLNCQLQEEGQSIKITPFGATDKDGLIEAFLETEPKKENKV